MSRYHVYTDDRISPQRVDCNCTCPAPTTWLPPVQVTEEQLLQQHPQCQQIALDAEHAVVYVPSLSKIAVLNCASQALLASFTTHRFPSPAEYTDDACRKALTQLVSARLLLPPTQCDTLPTPPEADELSAWLHVTNACNLRCTYCYVAKNDESMSAETGYAAINAILRTAQQYRYQRVLLKYAGGEASLNLALVEQLHQYAQQHYVAAGVRELDAVVLSNGVGLTHAKLAQIQALGLRLMISLDGMADVHDSQRPLLGGQGSFAAVLRSIERAVALSLPLTISITVTAQSVAGVADVVRWLLAHNLHFTLNFYREHHDGQLNSAVHLEEQQLIAGLRAAYAEIERNLPDYSLLGCLLDRTNLHAPHQRTCPVGQSYLVITQRGEIAACQMTLDQPVTNVHTDDPLAAIRTAQIGIRNLPVDAKSECQTCIWKYWCAGGCAVNTYRATRHNARQSPNCTIYKTLYPDVLRLEGLRLLRQHAPLHQS